MTRSLPSMQMVIGLLLSAAFLLTGCGTFVVETRIMTPAEATATAQAVLTPTPTPDLGKLAYVQGGDVWVKALSDGESRRLTADGRNRAPRWSSSGRWIAFRKGDYQVWVIRADGGDARPLNEGAAVDAFAWAPMEDRLAYVAGDSALHLVNADGTGLATLVPASPSGQIGRIAWSPDGAWIAYEWREARPEDPFFREGIRKVPADGGEPVEVYAGGSAALSGPLLVGWTGDGRFVLAQDNMHSASLLADGSPLYAIPADGGPLVALTTAVLAYSDFVSPAPGPTDRVALVAGGYRGAWTSKALHIVAASAGEGRALTSPEVAVSSPAWAPDGPRVAYVAMPDRGDLVGGETARQGLMQRRIWVADVESGEIWQLTDDPAYRDERPLWSADGSHILFARLDEEGRASLWLIPAEGGEPQQVVDELTPAPGWFGYYGHLDWDMFFGWWRGSTGQRTQPERSPSTTSPSLSAKALVRRAVEAVHRPGKAFYARLRIEDSDMSEVRTAQIWFDGERQAARREERRNGELTGVTVWEGWTSAHYAPEANRVYASTVPSDFRAQGMNPALEAFAPGLLSLPLQPEWEANVRASLTGLGEQDVNRPWRVEAIIPMPAGEWKDHHLRIIADVEGHTFLPIREQVRLESPTGQVRFTRTITYLETGFVDRDRLSPDFLTQAAVEALVVTLEQRLEHARRLDFTVWWLGQMYTHPFQDAYGQHRLGLTLTDVRFRKREGNIIGVVLEYGVAETSVTYVSIWEYPAAEWARLRADHQPWWQSDQAEAKTVVMHGVEGTLYTLAGIVPSGPELAPTPTVAGPRPAPIFEPAATPQVIEVPAVRPSSYTLVLPLGGTVIRLETSPMVSGGRQVNPFHSQEAIIALARALQPL